MTTEAPILSLDQTCIDQPSRMHLVEIENIMIWPDDPGARGRAKELAMIRLGRDMANAGVLSDSAVVQLLNLAVDAAPSPSAIDVKDRFERGLYAGKILFAAVSNRQVGRDAALGPIIDAITRQYLGRSASNSKVVYSRIWAPFRCVAHFWATHLFYYSRGHSAFPCPRDRLPMFLAIAEQFRGIAERTRSHPKAPKLIMNPGEAVQLPIGLKLPPGNLKFEAVH
jgi:hypothetical protein